MSDPKGSVGWFDLTVPDAEKVRDFYGQVVGWDSEALDMGDYEDFCMKPKGTEAPIAGICHARGSNTGLPTQWLMYITVDDVDASVARCQSLGGKVLVAPKPMGSGRGCVIQDPAGAVVALYQE